MKTKSQLYLKIIIIFFIISTIFSLYIVDHSLRYFDVNTKLQSINIYSYPSKNLFASNSLIEDMNELYNLRNSQLSLKYSDLLSQVNEINLDYDEDLILTNNYTNVLYLEELLSNQLDYQIERAVLNDVDIIDISNNARLNYAQKIQAIDLAINTKDKIIEPEYEVKTTDYPEVKKVEDTIMYVNNTNTTEQNQDKTCASNFKPIDGKCPSNNGYYQKEINYETTCSLISGTWNPTFEACFTITKDYKQPTCGIYNIEEAYEILNIGYLKKKVSEDTYKDYPISCNIYRYVFDDGTTIDVSDSGIIFK